MRNILYVLFCSIGALYMFVVPCTVVAQEQAPVREEIVEGRVVEIVPLDESTDSAEPGQKIKVELSADKAEGKIIDIAVTGTTKRVGEAEYKEGDRLVLARTENRAGEEIYYVRDFVRRPALLWLFLVFVILTVAVARWRGLTSLLGMALSFLVIFKFILPRILSGSSPIFVILISSLFIIPTTFFLSHGVNKKTFVSVGSTLISLFFTVALAVVFNRWARLTGFSSEEAAFLETMDPGQINFKGLVLAGMIVGVLGVLDDITVAQASVVEKLREANPRMPAKDLFFKALDVGRDHIASMVNTLVLVYAGASLPLLLLFVDTSENLAMVVNNETLAVEIIRTLVGSIGLIFAVPITTLLAVNAFPRPFSSQ